MVADETTTMVVESEGTGTGTGGDKTSPRIG